MSNNVLRQPCYQTVKGPWITVSREVYQMIRQENNRARKSARAASSCAQASYSHCKGDCLTCPWYTNGVFVPFGLMNKDICPLLASDSDVEEAAIRFLTMQQVYQHADQLVQCGAQILRLRFEANCSQREIARKLRISHTALNKRMRIMLTYFRENKQLFF